MVEGLWFTVEGLRIEGSWAHLKVCLMGQAALGLAVWDSGAGRVWS